MDTIPKKKRKHVSFDPKNKRSNKKTSMQFCRLCGLNPDHHTGNCNELGPLLYKEKKRKGEQKQVKRMFITALIIIRIMFISRRLIP